MKLPGVPPGVGFMLLSSVMFAGMGACVKYATETLPTFEIVFFRSLIALMILLPVMLRKKVSFTGKNRKILLLRGTAGFTALCLSFLALTHLKLGTAATLHQTSPLFVAVLSAAFLREKIPPILAGLLSAAFAGIILLIQPEFRDAGWAVFFGLGGGFFSALAYLSVRELTRTDHPMTIIFYFTAVATAGAAVLTALQGWTTPGGLEWLLIAGMGLFAYFGQIWLTEAYRHERASIVAPFSYAGTLLAFLFGILIWDETFNTMAILGACLLIAAGAGISSFHTRPEPPLPLQPMRTRPITSPDTESPSDRRGART